MKNLTKKEIGMLKTSLYYAVCWEVSVIESYTGCGKGNHWEKEIQRSKDNIIAFKKIFYKLGKTEMINSF